MSWVTMFAVLVGGNDANVHGKCFINKPLQVWEPVAAFLSDGTLETGGLTN